MAFSNDIRFSFLYIDLYSMGRAWVYPESIIPYNMLRYIVKGEAEFCINDKTIKVKENQIVYIPKESRMSCRAISDVFKFFSLRFTTSVIYQGYDILGKVYGIPRILENKGEDSYFKQIYKWFHTEQRAKKCFIRGNLNLLIGSLSMRLESNILQKKLKIENEKYDIERIRQREMKLHNQIDPRIRIVADYIILHPTEKYTPKKMSKMAGLSKQRFSSLFKKNMGKTPMQYIREIRLSMAAKMLLMKNENINDIAYIVGYEDTNYFIREFKSSFGLTPNQYRKAGRDV